MSEQATLVLALRVSDETYDTYLSLVSGKPGRRVKKDALVGNVIVVPMNSEAAWSWMIREQFDELYQAMESWSKSRFTMCELVL